MDGQEIVARTDATGTETAAAARAAKTRMAHRRDIASKPRANLARKRSKGAATAKSGPDGADEAPTRRTIRTLPICDWPKEERPREKLLARGAHALSDAELLAVLLRCGTGGLNAIELAQAHIVSFGSLRELLTAEFGSWEDKAGVGIARYAALQAALELAKRHLRESLEKGSALAAPETTQRFLRAELQHRPYEVFCCLYLDSHHRLIAFEELFRGTTEIAHVHIKEVVRQTLLHNASAVIFAHNHPSGVMQPSRADEDITRRLRHVLALMEVRVLDHLIVGNGGCYSFAEHGLL
jgi:DNA repair protein RadC